MGDQAFIEMGRAGGLGDIPQDLFEPPN